MTVLRLAVLCLASIKRIGLRFTESVQTLQFFDSNVLLRGWVLSRYEVNIFVLQQRGSSSN